MKLVLLLCVAVYGVHCEVAPFLTRCKASDTACMVESAQKAVPILAAGVPELGMTSLDPLFVKRVKANQAGLDMDMRNTKVTGLRKCRVLNMKRKANKMNIDVKCSVLLEGDYTLGGKLLILPIEGDGKYEIKIRNIVVKFQYELGEKEVGGEKYWTVVNWKYNSEVLTDVRFKFENLFKGNKQASDAIHQFANTQWKDIYQEVAPPVVKALLTAIVEEIKKLFDKVPIKELTLD